MTTLDERTQAIGQELHERLSAEIEKLMDASSDDDVAERVPLAVYTALAQLLGSTEALLTATGKDIATIAGLREEHIQIGHRTGIAELDKIRRDKDSN